MTDPRDIDQAASRIRAASPIAPSLGLVLGSGLGGLAGAIEEACVIPYADLPGFPLSGVAGHGNRLVLGRLAGLPVACLQGRVHLYEGRGAAVMATPIRALRRAGVETLLLTSAAGSLRPEIGPGRLMLISDHINLQPGNPLIGPNDETIGPRFPSLRDAYDPALRAMLRGHAARLGIPLAEGVYLACAGPSFETPAEIRAFRTLGADAIGMSMAAEVILARHCGLKVAALAIITNHGEGMTAASPSHDETLAVAARAATDAGALIRALCAALAGGDPIDG